MFKKKNRRTKTNPSFSTASIISSGNTITGNINSDTDLRIDGVVKGNVYCNAKLLVGADGTVEGNIVCREADITGTIYGNIEAKEMLHLKGVANVNGDIHTTKLFIEPTVSFNGQCQMGANIVELLPELPKAVNE